MILPSFCFWINAINMLKKLKMILIFILTFAPYIINIFSYWLNMLTKSRFYYSYYFHIMQRKVMCLYLSLSVLIMEKNILYFLELHLKDSFLKH